MRHTQKQTNVYINDIVIRLRL